MILKYKKFVSINGNHPTAFQQASDFAKNIQTKDLINISHAIYVDNCHITNIDVCVWYWDYT